MHRETSFCWVESVFRTKSMTARSVSEACARLISPWILMRSFSPGAAVSSISVRSLFTADLTSVPNGPTKSVSNTLPQELAMFRVNGSVNSSLKLRFHSPWRRRAMVYVWETNLPGWSKLKIRTCTVCGPVHTRTKLIGCLDSSIRGLCKMVSQWTKLINSEKNLRLPLRHDIFPPGHPWSGL